MVMRKRDRYQIVFQILEICKGGGSKTRMVFQVNLNFRTVNHHIDMLTDGRLLEVLDVPVILYRTIIVGIHT